MSRANAKSPRYVAVSALLNGAELRTAKCEGVDYIVAPVVAMIGDSVVWPVNADTPEYVPASVLSLAPEQWNNRPVCMSHPEVDGVYVSANTPEILESWSYGRTFNAYFDSSDNKLKMEAWMSESKAKTLGDGAQRVLERLRSGEIVEISIGAFIVAEKLDSVGVTSDGQEYGAIWLSVASDHLATLDEHSMGACSVEMGCGLLRVSASKLSVSILSQARTPTYTGTETSSWSTPSFADYVKYLHEGATGTGPKSVKECSSDLKRKISEHSLLGDPSANNVRELAFFPCVNPANGNLNEKALRRVLSTSEETSAIDSKALSSAKDVASRLLNSEFGITGLSRSDDRSRNIDVESEDDDMDNGKGKAKSKGLFSRLMKSLSSLPGVIKDNISNNQLRGKLWDALNNVELGLWWIEDYDTDAKTVVYTTRIVYGFEYDSEVEIFCWQRTYNIDSDNNVTINDDRIQVEFVGTYQPVKESGSETDITANESHECACKKGDDTMSSKKELIAKLKGNAAYKAFDEKMLESMTEPQLASLVEIAEKAESDGKTVVAGKDSETVVATVTPETVTPSVSSPSVSASKPVTDDEWLSIAPESVRSLVKSYQAKEESHRNDLIGRLKTASKFTEDKLKAMDTATLETLADSLEITRSTVADYSGRGVAVVNEADNDIYMNPPDPWAVTKTTN